MRNNIGFPNKNTNMGGVDTMFNTWDLNIAEAATDFVEHDRTPARPGPRQADGSMPAVDFLKLKAGSPLIDKGTNVGLPFAGAAPDLGAYEFGLAGAGGSGAGGGGAGGAMGGTWGQRRGRAARVAPGRRRGISGTAGGDRQRRRRHRQRRLGFGRGRLDNHRQRGRDERRWRSRGPGRGPGGASGGCNCALASGDSPLELGGLTGLLVLTGAIVSRRRARRRR